MEKAKNIQRQFNNVFFDKEIMLIEIHTYKVKHFFDKYEKEMQKLISYCSDNNENELGRHLALELGEYYYEKKTYKKAASFFYQGYRFEGHIHKNKDFTLEAHLFDY